MTRYCLGFVFNRDMTRVLLVEKKRGPDAVVGKWNGIGGVCREDAHGWIYELGDEAMARKGGEEVGLVTDEDAWTRFATISGVGHDICCLYTKVDDEVLDGLKALREEPVRVWSVYPIILAGSLPLAPATDWLIVAARAHGRGDCLDTYEVTR